jgi:steroid delta-isomerase-like uncharacterized protein
VVDHDPVAAGDSGIAAVHTHFRLFYTAFPHSRLTLDDLVAEGDQVAVRLKMRGLHGGTYLGVPATGKHVHWTENQWLRVAGGQVVERWREWDAMGLLEQLGVLPAPATPATLPGRAGEIRGHLQAAPGGPAITPGDNKALIRRWLEEAWNAGNLDVYNELIHPEAARHDHRQHLGYGAHPSERQRMVATIRAAIPDIHIAIEDQLAEGDKVATRWTLTGTHQAPLLGVPATGKQGAVTGIDISQIANGQLVEDWSEWDRLGFLRQLGLIPSGAAG